MERNEKIRQYKEMPQPMGIYQIKNLKNEKLFIGSAKDIHGRLNRIKFQLKNGLYPDKEIQKDYKEVGEDAFLIDVLDYLGPQEDIRLDFGEELKLLEKMWLEKIRPYGEKGYNRKK